VGNEFGREKEIIQEGKGHLPRNIIIIKQETNRFWGKQYHGGPWANRYWNESIEFCEEQGRNSKGDSGNELNLSS